MRSSISCMIIQNKKTILLEYLVLSLHFHQHTGLSSWWWFSPHLMNSHFMTKCLWIISKPVYIYYFFNSKLDILDSSKKGKSNNDSTLSLTRDLMYCFCFVLFCLVGWVFFSFVFTWECPLRFGQYRLSY